MSNILDQSDKEMPDAFIKSGSDKNLEISWVSTGVPKLDSILGKGLPRGKMVEVVGPYGAGKTLLCQFVIANVQKKGLTAALIDTEGGYDPGWHKTTGVDIDKLLVSQPLSGEIAMDTIIYLTEKGVDLIVLDSIAAVLPMAEYEDVGEEIKIGALARLLGRKLKKIRQMFNNRNSSGGPDNNPCLLMINQVRSGIGGPVAYETFPGGKPSGFFPSIIFRVRKGPIHPEGKSVGYEIIARTVKNKLYANDKECSLPFRFTGELDSVIGLIDLALEKGVITQGGSFFNCNEQKIQGKAKLIQYLKDNNLVEWLQEVVGNS